MIDLDSYSRQFLNALHKAGMACVYILAYEDGSPCRIGYAKRPTGKITEIRRANAKKLNLRHLVWTPSLGTAMLIEANARERLGQTDAGQQWLDYPDTDVIAAVNSAIGVLYPRAEHIVPHDAMLRRLKMAG